MSEIRSLGTAGRLKRALVASGLALATVSWLGVSAMPSSADVACSYLNGTVTFNPDDGGDDETWLHVSDTDGRLRVEYGGTDYICTANFTQTRQVKFIAIGNDTNEADDTYLDLGGLQDNGGVEISVYMDYDEDVAVYNTQDDPQGGLDIYAYGGSSNLTVEYGDIEATFFTSYDPTDSSYDAFNEVGIAGTGADDTIVADLDLDDNYLVVYGDTYDFEDDGFESWEYDADYCYSDRGTASDTIDVSGSAAGSYYAYIFGCDGDDTITGTADDDYLEGNDGFDWIEDGRGADDVDAEWFFAGTTQQGRDSYYSEDPDGDGYVGVFDYSARTRPVYLSNNDEYASGEVGENDYLDEDNAYAWLLGGSGDDIVVRGDYDAETLMWLQGGAGNNRLDCNGDTAGNVITFADYEFSPSAVNVDLATGTATGWGTDRLIGCDEAIGSEQADTLSGNGNSNWIGGGGGDDTINGAGASDYLLGDGGDDTVNGGDGNDDVVGGDGRDTLNGDAGNDAMGTTVEEEGDCNASDDTGMDDGIIDAFDLYELPGDGGSEAGNDKFNGGSGDDYMCGGTGEDRVMLSSGEDVFDGGAGRNIVDASGLESGVRIDLQLEEAAWDGWNTYLQRTKDAVGSNYNDRITAATVGALDGNVGSKISGRGGNDEIIGFSGPDQLRGNADNDVIFAGSGNDKLRGGAGNDELWGQGGVDTGNGGAGSDVCKSVERATGCETVLSRQQLV